MLTPEEEAALEWLEEHGDKVPGASLPSDHLRDPETGETVEYERSDIITERPSDHGKASRRFLSYSEDGLAQWEEWALARHKRMQGSFKPVLGRTPTPDELDTRVRTDRAMAQLKPQQQRLLRMRYFETMTLEAMAAELRVTKQAVEQRLRTCEQDLMVAITRTWHLPYDLRLEMEGRGKHEGRPSRPAEAERVSAELVLDAFYRERMRRGEKHDV